MTRPPVVTANSSPNERGVELLLDFLEAHEFRYVFGNPGTFEQSFMEALSRRHQLQYMLGLHESVAVAMADGYARASGQPAFVNVHASVGVANGLSQIYNAMVHRSPLLITAGQAQTRMLVEQPLLAADTVSLAGPFTKWAWELRRPEDLVTAIRRGYKVALSAPRGPIFLSLPIDVLDAGSDPVRNEMVRLHPPGRSQPDPEAVALAAQVMCQATRPVILCGDDVGRTGATGELVRFAETLGASVYALAQCEMSFPNDHPQFVRTLNPSSPATRDHLAGADAVMAVGTALFQQLLDPGVPILPAGVPIVHVVESDWEADKNILSTVALVADLASSLKALQAAVDSDWDDAKAAHAAARRAEARARKQDQVARLRKRLDAAALAEHIDGLHLMSVLRSVMPDEFTVIEEAPTAVSALQQVFSFSRPRSLFGNRGGALGWGMPAALGVQLALPGRMVVAVIGDGAANYSIQALWTAAHYQLPVKFVICNNHGYQVLRTNLAEYLPDADTRGLVGMDLTEPDVDYLTLAAGYGVPARRIEGREGLAAGLAGTLGVAGPALVEVALPKPEHAGRVR